MDSLALNLLLISARPSLLIVVDSSDQPGMWDSTAHSLEVLRKSGWSVEHLKSEPGLPRQRNAAINFVSKLKPEVELLSFLDDDVHVSSNYFHIVDHLFSTHQDLAVLGGFDRDDSNAAQPRKLLLSLGLEHPMAGKVSKSGLARVPNPDVDLQIVDFVPGGMQSLRLVFLRGLRFDESSLFYGEDIEFHLRLALHGRVASSQLLRVTHMSGQEGKGSRASRIEGEQLVRYRLHLCRPDLVRFGPLLAVAIVWMVFDVIKSLTSGPGELLLTMRSHCKSLLKIIAMKMASTAKLTA